jgi:hypothetical protein
MFTRTFACAYIATLFVGQLANAALPSASDSLNTRSNPFLDQRADKFGNLRTGVYFVTTDFSLPVFAVQDEGGSLNITSKNIQIPFEREDGLHVLEVHGEGPKAKVLIAFDQADAKQFNNFWTTQEHLSAYISPNPSNFNELFGVDANSLEVTPDTSEADLMDELDTASAEIGELATEQYARRGGKSGRVRGKGSFCTRNPKAKGCCYSAVKGYLLRTGLTRTRLAGQAARGATAALGKGWSNVGCGARSNPRTGMVCAYNGGRWGHTEVYNGRCWYYGYKCTASPMSSPSRRCITCKVKG